MAPQRPQSWPRLATLVMAWILAACGGSNPPDATSLPAGVTASGAPGKLSDTPKAAQLLIGYGDGSLVGFSPDTVTTAFTDFVYLPYGLDPTSPINFMASYDDTSNNHFMLVATASNRLQQWNGTVWLDLGYTPGGVPVKQMITFGNSVVVGLANGAVLQYAGIYSTALYDSRFNSAASQIVVDHNGQLVVGWDNKKIMRLQSCANASNGCVWTDLNSPASSSAITHMVAYTRTDSNNNQQAMLAISLSNGALFKFDGTQWQDIGNEGSAPVTQLVAFANDNSLGKSSFLVAYADGKVFQWDDHINNSPNSFLEPVIEGAASYGAVTQLLVYQDTVVAGFQGGEVLQASFPSFNVIQVQTLAGPGWGSAIKQMVVHNTELIVRLADSRLEEWSSNDQQWSDLGLIHFSSHPLTQMTLYTGNLLLAFDDGSIRQWNGIVNFAYTILHDAGWGSAIVQMVNLNHMPAVRLGNGAVELWNGIIWQELASPTELIPPCVYISDLNESYPTQLAVLATDGNPDRLLQSLSTFGDGVSRSTGAPVSFSTGLIRDLTLGFTVNPGQLCAPGSSYDASINRMIVDPKTNIVYAGSAGDGTVQMWDGNSAGSLIKIPGSGDWKSGVTGMIMYNTSLVALLANGAIEQYDATRAASGQNAWLYLLNPGNNFGGASITQSFVYNSTLLLGLNNGGVVQWNAGTQAWDYLHDNNWGAPVTQMTSYNGNLVIALGNAGAVERWDGGSTWTELHDNSWGAAVNQLLAVENYLFAGLANGAVEQWTDATQSWIEVPTPKGVAVTQMLVQ